MDLNPTIRNARDGNDPASNLPQSVVMQQDASHKHIEHASSQEAIQEAGVLCCQWNRLELQEGDPKAKQDNIRPNYTILDANREVLTDTTENHDSANGEVDEAAEEVSMGQFMLRARHVQEKG